MRSRVKASLLWGVVSSLAFLVLHQAYVLLGGEFISIGAVAGLTLAVGVVSASVSYLVEGWLIRRKRRV